MNTKKEVLAEALALPPTERAALIEELLSSFDFPERQRLDQLWGSESEARIDAYEHGEIASTPLDAVFEKINSWKK